MNGMDFSISVEPARSLEGVAEEDITIFAFIILSCCHWIVDDHLLIFKELFSFPQTRAQKSSLIERGLPFI